MCFAKKKTHADNANREAHVTRSAVQLLPVGGGGWRGKKERRPRVEKRAQPAEPLVRIGFKSAEAGYAHGLVIRHLEGNLVMGAYRGGCEMTDAEGRAGHRARGTVPWAGRRPPKHRAAVWIAGASAALSGRRIKYPYSGGGRGKQTHLRTELGNLLVGADGGVGALGSNLGQHGSMREAQAGKGERVCEGCSIPCPCPS